MVDFQLRPATCFDWPVIVRMFQSNLPWVCLGDVSFVLRNRRDSVWIATLSKRVVGFAVCYFKGPAEGAYLDYLAVASDRQGRGVGRRILQELEVIASQRCCNSMSLAVQESNVRAIKFYRGLGFVEGPVRDGNIGFRRSFTCVAYDDFARPATGLSCGRDSLLVRVYWRLVYAVLVEMPRLPVRKSVRR